MSVNKFKQFRNFAIATVAVALSGQALAAASTTTNMNVSAQVVATCSLTAADMVFGNYSGLAISSSAALSITCTNGAPYTIGLSAGNATGASTSTRQMVNSTNSTSLLSYGLYQDTGSTVWGIGADALANQSGSGGAQTVTVHGKVPAGQLTSLTGTYNDVVVATINY